MTSTALGLTAAETLPAGASTVPAVQLTNISFRYGKATAIDAVSLSVDDGTVLALVGPSGCGKSTLLRIIAGLLTPTEGTLLLGGDDATRRRAERRGIGYVPQSYALFPHLSVRDNVGFGLAARKVPRALRAERIREALELTRMSEFAHRMPSELSGGQRQRVALARALAIKPTVLLLDEPLSALDPQLRDGMRRDLRALLAQANCCTIIVTHDQSEALALADRVAVMRAGRVIQSSTVRQIWDDPIQPFVAEFVAGASTIEGRVSDGWVHLATDWSLPLDRLAHRDPMPNGAAFVAIRPASGVTLSVSSGDRQVVVVDAEPQGATWLLRVRLLTAGEPDARWPEIKVVSPTAWLPGQRPWLTLNAEGSSVHLTSTTSTTDAVPAASRTGARA